jgi:hypothetical protein
MPRSAVLALAAPIRPRATSAIPPLAALWTKAAPSNALSAGAGYWAAAVQTPAAEKTRTMKGVRVRVIAGSKRG